MTIPEKILQAGCDAYAATFLNGNGSLGDGIEAAYLAINHHDGWVRPGPPVWTGEGLPPVGTVCEYRVGDGTWFKCEIRYVTKPGPLETVEVVMYPPHLKGEQIGEVGTSPGKVSFRPIRTPEQIAAEEREAELNRMVATVSMLDKGWARNVCAGLYDAGYRKQVQS